MSEMVRYKGIVKRISTKDNIREVYDRLVGEGMINHKWTEFKDDKPTWIDSSDYRIVNGCIFDVSNAPEEYDSNEDLEEAERLNETDYKVHLYFYNGGADLTEVLEDVLPKADKDYDSKEQAETFYAIRYGSDSRLMTSDSRMPRMYKSKENALKALTQWPGIKEYKIVKFVESDK